MSDANNLMKQADRASFECKLSENYGIQDVSTIQNSHQNENIVE